MSANAPKEDVDTVDLVKEATRDMRELVALELALAKEELVRDLSAAKRTAALAGGAIVLTMLSLTSLLVALGVALGTTCSLVLAGALLVAALLLGALAYRARPGKLMRSTTERLQLDEALLKGHMP